MALLVRRVGGELQDFVLSSAPSADPATALAGALGAAASPCEVPAPLGGVRAVARVEGDGEAGRTSLAGVDPANAARLLAQVLEDGEEVLIVLRPLAKRQRRRWRRYAENMPGSTEHHTLKAATPLFATVLVTARDAGRARALVRRIIDPLPGWDTATRADTGSRLWQVVSAAVLAAAALIAGVLVGRAEGVGVALVLAALGLLRWVWHSPASQAGRVWSRALVPVPSARRGLLARGPWPFGRLVIPTSAPVVCSLVAPQAGASTGATATRARVVPPALLEEVAGPPVFEVSGRPVRIDRDCLWGGVGILGAPGSGKSVLLRGLFGWLLVDRERVAGQAVIAVETKPDGVAAYERMADAAGHAGDLLVVEAADPWGPAVDMFAREGDDVFARAEFITDAWAAAFGDGAIMGRSREVLAAVIAAGLVMDDEAWDACEATGLVQVAERSWFWAALVLTGRLGDEAGQAVHSALLDLARRAGRGSVEARACAGLGIIWGPGVSATARRGLVEAARNKFDQLKGAAHFLAPVSRDSYSWDQVLVNHGVVVVGTGPSRDGVHQWTATMTQWLTAMAGFTAQAAVERRCFGWRAEGRSVWVLVDEFKHFAGSAAGPAKWWRDDGRAYGVQLVAATQYPVQLAADVLASFLSLATFVSFHQDDPDAAETVARQMRRDGSEWEASEIATLPQWTAVVATRVHGVLAPPFTARSVDSESDPAAFIAGARQ
ncbi:MAG: hypothetical protein Q4C85_07155 [Actinomyces sp.]|uniref:hypothetical protein n=1 Tax=Actinomyces sp. TaxID=29317 RepID=UPI0026DADFC7|nr:hypothetical protein [Actinomyces sp.]MDO4243520.1 hypothetical protein [Actinomyces sp.]